MTRYTLVAQAGPGSPTGVRLVVAGGDGGKTAEGGAVVGTVETGVLADDALAAIGDQQWVFDASGGEFVGRWVDDSPGSTRMRAVRTSTWRMQHAVDLDGTVLSTRPVARGREWCRDGTAVGRSGRLGFWFPVVVATLPDELPVHAAAFVLWLEWVLVRRTRRRGAAAAG